jgi:hypothetical protein
VLHAGEQYKSATLRHNGLLINKYQLSIAGNTGRHFPINSEHESHSLSEGLMSLRVE